MVNGFHGKFYGSRAESGERVLQYFVTAKSSHIFSFHNG